MRRHQSRPSGSTTCSTWPDCSEAARLQHRASKNATSMGQCNRHHQSTHGCKNIDQRLPNCLLETNYKGINSKIQVRNKEAKALTISQCQETSLQHKNKESFFSGATGFDPRRFRTAPRRIYHVLCLLHDVVTKVHYHLQVLQKACGCRRFSFSPSQEPR